MTQNREVSPTFFTVCNGGAERNPYGALTLACLSDLGHECAKLTTVGSLVSIFDKYKAALVDVDQTAHDLIWEPLKSEEVRRVAQWASTSNHIIGINQRIAARLASYAVLAREIRDHVRERMLMERGVSRSVPEGVTHFFVL